MATRHAPGRRGGVAIGLTLAAVVASVLVSIPALVVPLDPLALFVAATVLSELGFAAVAVAFVLLSGAGVRYLRLSVPDRRGWLFVVGGTIGMFALRMVALLLVQSSGFRSPGTRSRTSPGSTSGRSSCS